MTTAAQKSALAQLATTTLAHVNALVPDDAQPPVDPPPVIGAWLPAPGKILNTSLNLMADVCPPITNVTAQGGVLNDTGMVFVTWLGDAGSDVWTGGGHTDYFLNELYRHDRATRKFSRLTDPDPCTFGIAPAGVSVGVPGYYCETVHGETWADAAHTLTKQNQPGAGHLFGYLVPIPPGVAGMGVNGGVMSVLRPNLAPSGSATGRQSHILDLAAQVAAGPANSQWKRIGGLVVSTAPGGCGACYDSKRKRVWATDLGGAGKLYYFDLDDPAQVWKWSVGTNFYAYYGTLMYAPELDRVLWYRGPVGAGIAPPSGSPPLLLILDPANPTVTVHATLTGDQPPLDGFEPGGADWCPDLAGGPGVVYYAGNGGFDCFRYQPTDSTLTTWKGTKQTLTGDQPVAQLSNMQSTHLGRFRYGDKRTGVCNWLATNRVPMQSWGVV